MQHRMAHHMLQHARLLPALLITSIYEVHGLLSRKLMPARIQYLPLLPIFKASFL